MNLTSSSARRLVIRFSVFFSLLLSLPTHLLAAEPPLRKAPNLTGAVPLPANHHGEAAVVQALNSGQAQPVSLAAGDLDQDGITDLVAGYATPTGGVVVFHRGNVDAFAPQSQESFLGITRGQYPAPFLPDTKAFSVPLRPDFLVIGSFTASGHEDLAVASRGGSAIYIFAGDGKGSFTHAQVVNLRGTITALEGGYSTVAWPFTTLVVGTADPQNAYALNIYAGSEQGLTQRSSYALRGPATAIAFGRVLPGGAEAAVLAGGELRMLHAAAGHLDAISLPASAVGLAVGLFIREANSGYQQVALLASDGSMQIAGFNGDWQIMESFSAVAGATDGALSPLVVGGRISGQAADDVMAFSPDMGTISAVSHAFSSAGQVSQNSYTAVPVAAVAMRVSVSPRLGLVVLEQGRSAPSVMTPMGDPTFNVNTTADTTQANACANAVANQCSLREAIAEANAASGTYIINVPSNTYTLGSKLVIFPGGISTTNISVVGGGAASTFVQTGTNSSNGIDRILDVDFNFGGPSTSGQVTSLSGLTFRFGQDPVSSHSGGISWNSGMDGNGQLTITNCTISDNSTNTTANGGGGLEAVYGNSASGTGFTHITGSTIQNNHTIDTSDSSAATEGGGILFNGGTLTAANVLVMTNTQVLNNTAHDVGGTPDGFGAGIFLTNTVSPVIHNSVFSGNSTDAVGGGLFVQATKGLLIDQDTVISNNTAGHDGGGLVDFDGSASGNPADTLSHVTITGNSGCTSSCAANTGRGGGIVVEANTNLNFNISFSRIAGNSAATGPNLFNNCSNVTATNNWWGTNTPAGTLASSNMNPTCTGNAPVNTFDPFIVLSHTANPTSIGVNTGTSTLTASFLQDNHSTVISGANLDALNGTIAFFGNPVPAGALVSGSPTMVASGTATATYHAGTAAPTTMGHADVTIDQQTVTSNNITIQNQPAWSITKTHSGNFFRGQTGAIYTITATNNGGASTDGTQVTVTDTVPPGLTPTGPTGTVNGWTCNVNSLTLTCTRSDVLTAGSSFPSITLTVNVANNAAASVMNSVSVTGGGAGTANTTDATNINANPSISKQFAPTTIVPPAASTLTFTLMNPNSGGLTGVAFSDTFPAGLTVANPAASSNTCGGTLTGATPGSGSVSLSGGSIAGGASCTITVNVTAGAGTYNNVSGAITSTNGGTGNTASASLTVQAPILGITKTHSGTFNPGQTGATYTVAVSNTGTGPTSGTVTVTDTLPTGLTPTGPTGTVNGWTCAAIVGQNVSCTRADPLAAGSSYPALTVVVNVASNASGTVTNTAMVSGGGDPNSHQASDMTLIGSQVQITPPAGGANLTLTQGNLGILTFTVDSSAGPVNVTFSGQPTPITITASPNPAPPGHSTVAVTIATVADMAALPPPAGGLRTIPPAVYLLAWISLLSLLGFCSARKLRKQAAVAVFALSLLGLVVLVGCGGGHHVVQGTPRGTSVITMTGTGTGASATTTINLTVQ